MPSADLAARLATSLSQLHRVLRAGMADGAVSPAALSLLARLRRDGAASPSQLATAAGVKLQSLTRLLATLESAGYINRLAHPDDARQTLLSLTTPGRALLKNEARRRQQLLSRLMVARLNPAERDLLAQALPLLDRICQPPAAAPQGDAASRRSLP